ncbi:MAG TPA: tetratricopeptide repeat protein [Candidatus Obscuribacterales bacterium]
MKQVFSRTVGLMAAALTLAVGYGVSLTTEVQAQTILEEQGTIEPALRQYPLEMEVGDVVTIIMTSEDFDPVLSLLGPDGEEVAANDDFGGTLNSRIVYSATTAGSFTVVTKSFDGEGGDFNLSVRPATEYEVAFNQAQMSMEARDFDAAIAAYSDAIAVDPANPESYLGRADAYFGKAQADLEAQGEVLEEPGDLTPEIRAAIVADFATAAELYEAEGDPFTAQSLREQIQYIETGEFSTPTDELDELSE